MHGRCGHRGVERVAVEATMAVASWRWDLFVQVQELHAFSAVTASGPPGAVAALAHSVALLCLTPPLCIDQHQHQCPAPAPSTTTSATTTTTTITDTPAHTSVAIQNRGLCHSGRESRQGKKVPSRSRRLGHPSQKGLDRDPRQVPCSPVHPLSRPCQAKHLLVTFFSWSSQVLVPI